jgi:hypothetical protein
MTMTNENVPEQQEDDLDEQLMETFPASDPPSNTVITGVGHLAAGNIEEMPSNG